MDLTAFEAYDREDQAALELQGKQARVFANEWTQWGEYSSGMPPPLAC